MPNQTTRSRRQPGPDRTFGDAPSEGGPNGAREPWADPWTEEPTQVDVFIPMAELVRSDHRPAP